MPADPRRRPVRDATRGCAMFAMLVLLIGCDAPFGLGSEWVEGDWLYRATNLSGGGFACDVEGLAMTLDQEGTAFTGRASNGTFTCRRGRDTLVQTIRAVPITEGRVEGTRVTFNLGTADSRHTASVSGRSMNGTVRWWLDLGGAGGPVVLSGPFAAARQ